MSNENETMVFIKAINGHVRIGKSILFEGDYRLVPMTPGVEKMEKMRYIKTFSSEEEAAKYKYDSLSKKGMESVASFALKPVPPKQSIIMTPGMMEAEQKKYESDLKAWEADHAKATVTPFGDTTSKGVEDEIRANQEGGEESDGTFTESDVDTHKPNGRSGKRNNKQG